MPAKPLVRSLERGVASSYPMNSKGLARYGTRPRLLFGAAPRGQVWPFGAAARMRQQCSGMRIVATARHMYHQIETSLPTAQEALIREMAEAIVQEVDAEQAIRFGSRARSDATAESEVDLIVVEAEPVGNGRSGLAEEARLDSPDAKGNFGV